MVHTYVLLLDMLIKITKNNHNQYCCRKCQNIVYSLPVSLACLRLDSFNKPLLILVLKNNKIILILCLIHVRCCCQDIQHAHNIYYTCTVHVVSSLQVHTYVHRSTCFLFFHLQWCKYYQCYTCSHSAWNITIYNDTYCNGIYPTFSSTLLASSRGHNTCVHFKCHSGFQ